MTTITSAPPTPEQDILDLLSISEPYGAASDQLALLQGMGIPLCQLIKASITLHSDAGAALMAVPAPLPLILGELPEAVAEQAILGFTVKDLLSHPEIKQAMAQFPDRWRGWSDLPDSLKALDAESHPLTYQVLYLGTLLYHPGTSARWERALEVMRRLPSPRALAPNLAPVTPQVSMLYDLSPMDPANHPFLYFAKNPVR